MSQDIDQFSSATKLCPTLCDLMDCYIPGFLVFTVSQSWLKFMSVELVMPSNHLIFFCHFLFLPSIFPSIRVFSSVWALHIRWPKYWSFSFSISPSSEYQGCFPLGLRTLKCIFSSTMAFEPLSDPMIIIPTNRWGHWGREGCTYHPRSPRVKAETRA